jgi:hypothetical protein
MTCGTKGGEIHLYTPMKAIRRKCIDCCCGSSQEVGLCHIKDCALHPYRFGRRPGGEKREMTPARKEALRKATEGLLKRRISALTSQNYEDKLENVPDEG